MGHAGMAATAVRHLRAVGAPTAVEPLPRPALRAVREDERAPVEPGEFRRVLGHFASGVARGTALDARGPGGVGCQSCASLSPLP
ncbi:flavin reductase, partial [Streptomyces sp. NPDC059082]